MTSDVSNPCPTGSPRKTRAAPIAMLGVPFDNVTTTETVALVERMVASGRPHYLATANVDFLVQAVEDVELRRILFEAHLVLCDGTPLVWASRWLGNPLSERVAGSDLVPLLIRIAAEKGYRVFFLGGSQEATVEAVNKLQVQHPHLIIAGHYSPPFQTLLEMDHEEIKSRVQSAKPDLLFVSFGCPKQEKWIAMHYRSLRVPVSIGVGGTIDFLAGRLARAPLWMQRSGTEWIFRLAQEPRRLFKRYAKDCWYFGTLLMAQWCRMQFRSRQHRPANWQTVLRRTQAWQEVQCPEWLDAEMVERHINSWEKSFNGEGHLLLDLSKVQFIDSTGVGLLVRLRKQARLRDCHLVLMAPSPPVKRALEAMRLWPFFTIASDPAEAKAALDSLTAAAPTVFRAGASTFPSLAWQGEVTAANAEAVWTATEGYLTSQGEAEAELIIDLSEVPFADSTAVGLMVRARKHASKHDFKLTFVGVQPNVRNVIRLSKLEQYLLEP